jgi:hypothetical protein
VKSHYFDVIIIGSGLASRIAAFLAGRRGRRILLLSEESEPVVPPELPCGIHLNKLLPILGMDRQQLHITSTLQLIGERHRLDLTARSLEDEWCRELKNQSEGPARLLQNFASWGAKLDQSLASQSPSLLFSMRSQIRLVVSAWKPGGIRMPFTMPLAKHLLKHAGQDAQPLLQDLFCGLSGVSADRLTIAQAALLWYWSCLPTAVAKTPFLDMLRRRSAQFQITEIPLTELDLLHWAGRDPEGILLKDGTRLKGSQFVLASSSATDLLPAAKHTGQPAAETQRPTWRTTPINKDSISPLLGGRIVLSGPMPLLVTRHETDSETRFMIEGETIDKKPTNNPEAVNRQLKTLLPFSDFDLENLTLPAHNDVREKRRFRPCGLPCNPPRRNLVRAVPEELCPGLGSNGEILLGFALAEQLLRPKC